MRKLFFIVTSFFVALSCSGKQPVAFVVEGCEQALLAETKKQATGLVPLGKNLRYTYTFESAQRVPKDASLEIEYTVQGTGDAVLILNGPEGAAFRGARSWQLPLDASIMTDLEPTVFRYAVPLVLGELAGLTIQSTGKEKKDDAGLQINAVRVCKRWFGFDWDKDGGFSATPFVEGSVSSASSLGRPESWVVNPPLEYRIDGALDLTVRAFPFQEEITGNDRITVEPGTVFYEWTCPHNLHQALVLVPGALPYSTYPLRITVNPQLGTLRLAAAPTRVFPLEPVPADPGLVLTYQEGDWRDKRYEVFRWEGFPSVLIFDTANYAVQDKLFRRLAFFVEKEGYRGQLLTDQELAGQHGWNAHDYRAEDLARFFAAVAESNFQISAEEKELKDILVANGILKEDAAKIRAGEGALISISRESSEYLRRQFMAHEGFHGIFFIDEDFYAFSKKRYEQLSATAKNFIRSFFDYQHYDIKDEYLVINEFQAHVLQQAVSQAGWYFGGNLAARIEASPWRRAILPKKDEASATWPEIAAAFKTEAQVFSDYVEKRWGLEAGRTWRLVLK